MIDTFIGRVHRIRGCQKAPFEGGNDKRLRKEGYKQATKITKKREPK